MVTRKIAAGIVRLRTGILLVMLALAVVCAGCIGKTHINYELTRYLNSETMTRRALDVMQAEFGSSEQLRIMFRDVSADTLSSCVARLNALPEIQLAAHDPETGEKTVDGVACSLVALTLNADCDAAALVTHLREMFPECGEYAVGGAAATQLDVQRSVGEEMPQALLIAVAVVLAVLLLTSHAWLEPVLILVTLGVSILINMGTNFVFPDVSFVTFAVCAILQLALSIDYAIMLLHSFNGLCDEGLLPKDAMIEALRRSFMPVSSSAFTTIAGLLALLFMSFTIGFDIGLVLSKGILISMVTVFLLMPALTTSGDGLPGPWRWRWPPGDICKRKTPIFSAMRAARTRRPNPPSSTRCSARRIRWCCWCRAGRTMGITPGSGRWRTHCSKSRWRISRR